MKQVRLFLISTFGALIVLLTVNLISLAIVDHPLALLNNILDLTTAGWQLASFAGIAISIIIVGLSSHKND